MYLPNQTLSEEELEKKRKDQENFKRKTQEQMREHQRIVVEHEIAQREEEREQQEREEQQKPKKIVISNLRWEHTDKDIRDLRPDFVQIGDTIKLYADVENGDGQKATFSIHDNQMPANIDPAMLVEDKSTTVESGSCSVEWKVSDSRSKKELNRNVDLYFVVNVQDEYSDNCEIPFREFLKISLEIDPDQNNSDQFNLFSNDGNRTYDQTKTIEDDSIENNDTLDLVFTGLKPELQYTLEVIPGDNSDTYSIFKDRIFGEWGVENG